MALFIQGLFADGPVLNQIQRTSPSEDGRENVPTGGTARTHRMRGNDVTSRPQRWSGPLIKPILFFISINIQKTINVVSSNPAVPGSITSRVNFLFEVFPVFFLNCKTNFRKFRPHSSPVIIWLSLSSKNILFIRLRTSTMSDLRCTGCIRNTSIR